MSDTTKTKPSGWWYCIHCERCFFHQVESRWDAGVPDEDTNARLGLLDEEEGRPWLKCPYADCDGDPKDFWDWIPFVSKQDNNGVSLAENPGYAMTPEIGVVYPMHSKTGWKPKKINGFETHALLPIPGIKIP